VGTTFSQTLDRIVSILGGGSHGGYAIGTGRFQILDKSSDFYAAAGVSKPYPVWIEVGQSQPVAPANWSGAYVYHARLVTLHIAHADRPLERLALEKIIEGNEHAIRRSLQDTRNYVDGMVWIAITARRNRAGDDDDLKEYLSLDLDIAYRQDMSSENP
jgi:hypothetical protein